MKELLEEAAEFLKRHPEINEVEMEEPNSNSVTIGPNVRKVRLIRVSPIVYSVGQTYTTAGPWIPAAP